jgi:LysR family nitrogen assimilation transcriptional regulator
MLLLLEAEARLMDLANWKLFLSVSELGSLTKAGVMLDTAQSVISRKISSLERQCGGRLFHRTGRGVALTELGERVLPRVRALLFEAEQLANEVKTTAGVPVGEVRVGLLPSTASSLVATLFRRVRERFPGVRLHVFEGSSGQIEEWLTNGRLDIAILFRYGKVVPADEQALAHVDSFLVGPARDPLTRSPTVKFAQLDGVPLILPGAPNGLRVALDQAAKRKRISLSIVMEADSIPIQKDMVASGVGYTVIAFHAVSREVQAGQLQASRIILPGIDRTIALATTTQRPLTLATRETAQLIRLIVDELLKTGVWKKKGR